MGKAPRETLHCPRGVSKALGSPANALLLGFPSQRHLRKHSSRRLSAGAGECSALWDSLYRDLSVTLGQVRRSRTPLWGAEASVPALPR